jgi:hypothetical protein
MTDIFHEIEEDLRRDRFQRLWSRFGIYFILLVVAIIAGAGAWSGYRWWSQQQAQASGARFEAASQLAEEGKPAEAEAAFAAIIANGTTGYRVLARFRAAGELSLSDKPGGAAAFDALAADGTLSTLTRDIARVRAALLLVDTAPLADIQTRMQTLADSQSALRHSAREIIALAQVRAGELAAANKTATSIMDDPEVPAGVRNRADLVRTLTAASAPAPSAPAAAGAATQ